MPDSLGATGLAIKTLPEIVSDLETALRNIYGSDINLDQNSPDGQLVNIFAQAAIDIRELAQQIYNGFNPDAAVGRILDERVALNNIERQGGTYTITPIELVTDRTVNLQGLDADFNDPDGTGFTIQDDAGNKFILIDSVTLTAGTNTVNFRAKNIGAVETTTGTITNPVTIVLGVTSINNPSAALQTGSNEETDAELRIRRQKSVAIASTGYLNGLLASVLNLDGVTDAVLYENVTNSVDADGIPAHGIWLVAEGGANTDIADEIYAKKSYGANMKGDTEVDITTASGAIFTAKFDRPEAKDLFIRFDIQPLTATATFNQAAIKDYLVANLSYNIGEYAETSRITCIIKDAITSLGEQGAAINVEISDDNATWVDYLTVDTLDEQWVVDAARITITEL